MPPNATITTAETLNADRTEELERLLQEESDNERAQERLERRTDSLKRFRIEPDADLEYETGMEGRYITFTHEIDGEEIDRHYSIANSAEDYEETGEIELCVRLVEDGAFTPELFDMEEGDRLEMSGPDGHFLIDPDPDKDVLMIDTGTGVAPFSAGIEALYDDIREGERDVTLVHGSRWEDDLAYHAEFQQMDAEYDSFDYVPTLSGEPDWDGEDRYVQDVAVSLFEDGELDPDSTEVYICGLKEMVNEAAYRMVDDDRAEGEGLSDPIEMQDLYFERFN